MEAGQAVLQAARQARQDQGDLPRRRLSRHAAGRARPSPESRRMKATFEPLVPGTLPRSQHQLYRAPEASATTPKAFGRWAADRIERGDPVRGSGHRSRGLPGAGAELRRLLPAAARLLRAGARDLRRVRRPAGLRRGHLRLRPDRHDVRLRQVRLRAGHDHLRQGDDLRLLPDRRDDRLRPAVRTVQARRHHFYHGYTFGGHPVSAAVAMANLDIFEREGLNQHVTRTPPAFRRDPGEAAGPADRRRRPRRRATSTASSWSRTRPPRRRSTTTSPSGCCAASCPRRCSTPACTAAPTTAATPWSSSPRR